MDSKKLTSTEIEYFWDSYAVIEFIHGNLNYQRFADKEVNITIFNLVEIYWSCLSEYNEMDSNQIYDKYKEAVKEIDDSVLKEAIKFRKEHKKKDVSYTDCIGYIYAKNHKLKFLTGDKEFEKFPNVEFVK